MKQTEAEEGGIYLQDKLWPRVFALPKRKKKRRSFKTPPAF
jgi:hypothetical protein